MQYVKKQGNFWIKTNERTGWWIAGKRSDVFIITNGFVCQYVKKELIKDAPALTTQNQTEQTQQNLNQATTTSSEANLNPATQTQTKQISNLNQATTSTTTSNQTTSTSEANLTTKRKRGRPPAPQVLCPKCSKFGIVIERLVKSYIYRCIRHKENGKIKECVIQNISKAIYR
jgi:hypothetical protein